MWNMSLIANIAYFLGDISFINAIPVIQNSVFFFFLNGLNLRKTISHTELSVNVELFEMRMSNCIHVFNYSGVNIVQFSFEIKMNMINFGGFECFLIHNTKIWQIIHWKYIQYVFILLNLLENCDDWKIVMKWFIWWIQIDKWFVNRLTWCM